MLSSCVFSSSACLRAETSATDFALHSTRDTKCPSGRGGEELKEGGTMGRRETGGGGGGDDDVLVQSRSFRRDGSSLQAQSSNRMLMLRMQVRGCV